MFIRFLLLVVVHIKINSSHILSSLLIIHNNFDIKNKRLRNLQAKIIELLKSNFKVYLHTNLNSLNLLQSQKLSLFLKAHTKKCKSPSMASQLINKTSHNINYSRLKPILINFQIVKFICQLWDFKGQLAIKTNLRVMNINLLNDKE